MISHRAARYFGDKFSQSAQILVHVGGKLCWAKTSNSGPWSGMAELTARVYALEGHMDHLSSSITEARNTLAMEVANTRKQMLLDCT